MDLFLRLEVVGFCAEFLELEVLPALHKEGQEPVGVHVFAEHGFQGRVLAGLVALRGVGKHPDATGVA